MPNIQETEHIDRTL